MSDDYGPSYTIWVHPDTRPGDDWACEVIARREATNLPAGWICEGVKENRLLPRKPAVYVLRNMSFDVTTSLVGTWPK